MVTVIIILCVLLLLVAAWFIIIVTLIQLGLNERYKTDKTNFDRNYDFKSFDAFKEKAHEFADKDEEIKCYLLARKNRLFISRDNNGSIVKDYNN